MTHPILQLTTLQIKEFFREPGAVFWSFGFPILMALGLGIAFSGKNETVHGVAVIASQQEQTRYLSEIFPGEILYQDTIIEKRFDHQQSTTRYVFHLTDWENAELLMKRGLISVILKEEEGKITYFYDPLNTSGELIQVQLSNYFATGNLSDNQGVFVPLENTGLRYIDFFIPGLLTLGIMMSVMWGVSYSLIEKRAKKLLRRMVATPMRKSHFLISMWASRLLLTLFDSIVLILFAQYIFQVEIQGSFLALILLLLSGNVAFFGLAIITSSRTANMQVGNGLVSFITTPMMVLSGIFFSYQNFPDWAIGIIKVLPLTKFTDTARSIFNEGAGLMESLDGILIMIVFGIITFVAGLKMYKWY